MRLAAIVAHRPRRHQALVILAAGTGLRQGEIFGLTVDRLDLERRTVLVNRQLLNVNGREPFFGLPKSQASVRVVPLPSIVVEALRARLRAHPSKALVVTNSAGAPPRRSEFWTEWNRALTEAGEDFADCLRPSRWAKHITAVRGLKVDESADTPGSVPRPRYQ